MYSRSLLADALTKVMISKQLLHTLTTGEVCFRNEENHPIEARRLPQQEQITEGDLELGDEELLNQCLSMGEIKSVQYHVDADAGQYGGHATSRTRASRSSREPRRSMTKWNIDERNGYHRFGGFDQLCNNE